MIRLFHIGVSLMLFLIVLFWTLLPLMQHAIDRTAGFWIFWGMVEAALLTFVIAVFRRKA